MKRPEEVKFEQEALKTYGSKGSIALELALQTNEDLKYVSKWTVGIGAGLVSIGEVVRRKKKDSNLGIGIQVAGLAIGVLGFIGERYFDRQANLAATEMVARVEKGQFAEYVQGKPVTQPRSAADIRRLIG